MGKALEFLTPVGRLVQGDCFEAQTKDQNGVPLTIKTGANAGQPTQKYFVAVAFKKTDAAFAQLKAQFEQVARTAFPALFPNGGTCVNPNFSWKIVDGDGIDQNGKPNSTKEGFAGHWIVRFSSSYAPKCFAAGHYQPHEQLTDPKSIPRGHYVRIAGNVSDNIPSNKPGLYVNLNMIEWASIGDVIVSGPDAATVFGSGAPSSPGAAAGPVMTPAAGATTYAQYIAAGWTDAQLIASGFMVAAPAVPPALVAAPPAPSAPAPAVPPAPAPIAPHTTILAGPTMTPAAGATTYAQYIAAGWNDAQLIASGFMVAPVAAAVPAPLPPAGSAPPPAPPAPTAVAPAPMTKQAKMLPAAGATTYDQYIGAGWTDAQLIQNNFMLA